ncbi:MAG: hypothetical protein FWF83_07735 [Clostridiales bacterium]|nr:hypothetical protein [Clostridiales bacterium]
MAARRLWYGMTMEEAASRCQVLGLEARFALTMDPKADSAGAEAQMLRLAGAGGITEQNICSGSDDPGDCVDAETGDASAGEANAGAASVGAANVGVASVGAANAGAASAGVASAGDASAREASVGVTNAGAANAGAANAGAASAGEANAGVASVLKVIRAREEGGVVSFLLGCFDEG